MSNREEQIERVTKAILLTEDVPYSIRLTRLVDEECTYELRYDDGEPEEFPSHEDAMEQVQLRKSRRRAIAVLYALGLLTLPHKHKDVGYET